MPAYAKDGKVICFFRSGQKFKERYMTLGFNNDAKLDEGHMWPITLGFNNDAKLDEGHMWPITFALKELTAAEESKIGALVKKAVS
jgi:uncharacterized protein YdhG (YjbR/CyaY superfamily)